MALKHKNKIHHESGPYAWSIRLHMPWFNSWLVCNERSKFFKKIDEFFYVYGNFSHYYFYVYYKISTIKDFN